MVRAISSLRYFVDAWTRAAHQPLDTDLCMTTLWITGAEGFVGQALTKSLAIDSNRAVRLFAPTTALELRDQHSVESAAREAVAAGVRHIVHLAAMTFVPDSVRDPEACLDVNFMGTSRLCLALRNAGFVGRFLFVSTSDVYGNVDEVALPVSEITPTRPGNPYAVSKRAAEEVCLFMHRTHGMDIVIARPFNHIGAGQREQFVVSQVARQLAQIRWRPESKTSSNDRHPLTLGDLSPTRDFTDVRDVVSAYLALLDSARAGEIYNVCSGRERSIASVVDEMVALSNLSITVRRDDRLLRKADLRRMFGDSGKIFRDTGWCPRIEWIDTLRSVLDDWKQRIEI